MALNKKYIFLLVLGPAMMEEFDLFLNSTGRKIHTQIYAYCPF